MVVWFHVSENFLKDGPTVISGCDWSGRGQGFYLLMLVLGGGRQAGVAAVPRLLCWEAKLSSGFPGMSRSYGPRQDGMCLPASWGLCAQHVQLLGNVPVLASGLNSLSSQPQPHGNTRRWVLCRQNSATRWANPWNCEYLCARFSFFFV